MNEELAHLYFDNGYGVSIQRTSFHHSGSTSHEVALLHRVTNNEQHRVCSQRDIAPDGIKGWQSGDSVAWFIHEARMLPTVEYCTHKRREE
jgi:hypothetical protein